MLIDCWGHSAGSRLGVFARNAAPVQVAWINFVQTTGLERMDYVLHADTMDAPGTAELFTETVVSTGEVIIPFRPHPNRPPTAPTPALRLGRITFGSFNHPAKLSDATVQAWGRILRRPGSQLLLKYRYFVDPVLQSVTRARFAAERVDPSRIHFQGHSEGAEYLASSTRSILPRSFALPWRHQHLRCPRRGGARAHVERTGFLFPYRHPVLWRPGCRNWCAELGRLRSEGRRAHENAASLEGLRRASGLVSRWPVPR